jgi:prepilin-type N-terminal cleavage/methylation domain-containing protein
MAPTRLITRHTKSRQLRRPHRVSLGFTLVELLVVIAILSILGGLSLAALRGAAGRGKADSTRNVITALSDALLEQYESYEDLAVATARSASDVVAFRKRLREEMPDSWADVAPSANVPTPSYAPSRAYQQYKAAVSPTSAYAGAECLYMILTQSGLFPDFLENFSSKFVGDIDKDGAFEFWDGWGRPISFIRWAPGAMPLGRRDAATYHDPLDPYNADATAFALVPLIFSPGPDEALNDPMGTVSGYGLLSVAEKGWPSKPVNTTESLGTAVGESPCTFNPDGKGLVGAPDPANPTAYRDNISNYDKLFE